MMNDEVAIVYMDKVDFDEELGCAADGNKVYPSQASLEKHQPCVRQCGIVEIEIRLRRVIRETEYDFSTMPRGPFTEEQKAENRRRVAAIQEINDQIAALQVKKHQIRRGKVEEKEDTALS